MKAHILLALILLAGPSSAAVIWGAQCGDSCIGRGSSAQNAIATVNGAGGWATGFGGTAVRERITIEHPITDAASGNTCVSQADLDPTALDNTIKLVNGCKTSFAASGTATSDFWGGATVQYTRNGQVLTITSDGTTPVYPTYFIAATNNFGELGAGNVVALAQAQGFWIDYTFFNAASDGSASDDLIRDQNGAPCQSAACNADFQANLLYTWKDILATAPGGVTPGVWTMSNEETGGNSVTIGTNTAIANGGSGYSAGTTVSLTGGGGSGFQGVVLVTGGAVTSVNVSSGGSGYVGTPTVVFSGGCTATGTANINPVSFAIRSIMINSGGSGCTQGSQLTLSNGATIGVTGVSGGAITTWQYGDYPTALIYGAGAVVPTATVGGGTGATFTFQLSNNGDYSGNEVKGSYSVTEYQQKLTNAVIAGHSVGMKVGDSGFQGVPLYISYWNDQFYGPLGPSATVPTPVGYYPTGGIPGSCGTLACKQNMDGLAQTFFSKNVNQIDYGGNLPNSCGTGSGALTNGQILNIQRVHALVGAEIAAKTDFQNFHWYQVVPWSTWQATQWLASINGNLPLEMDEVGEYGNSYADAANIAAGCQQMGAFACIWWNRNSAGSRAIVLQYPLTYQVPVTATLNQNGQAWSDAIAITTPLPYQKPYVPQLPLC